MFMKVAMGRLFYPIQVGDFSTGARTYPQRCSDNQFTYTAFLVFNEPYTLVYPQPPQGRDRYPHPQLTDENEDQEPLATGDGGSHLHGGLQLRARFHNRH